MYASLLVLKKGSVASKKRLGPNQTLHFLYKIVVILITDMISRKPTATGVHVCSLIIGTPMCLIEL